MLLLSRPSRRPAKLKQQQRRRQRFAQQRRLDVGAAMGAWRAAAAPGRMMVRAVPAAEQVAM
eukprot:7790727-Pyramimonas_sp.AAC.1